MHNFYTLLTQVYFQNVYKRQYSLFSSKFYLKVKNYKNHLKNYTYVTVQQHFKITLIFSNFLIQSQKFD